MQEEDEESDESDWGSSDSESSSLSEYETGNVDLREYFKKKAGADKDSVKDRTKIKDKKRDDRAAELRNKKLKGEQDDALEGKWETVKGGALAERPKMFSKDQEINTGIVVKKLAEVTAVRGKKVG